MVILLYIVASVILIILLLQYRLTIEFTFRMENSVSFVYVTVYFIGDILKKKIVIFPSTKAKKVRKKLDVNQLKAIYIAIKDTLLKSLVIKDFKLYVREGTGDACYTAMLYGALWNLIGLLEAFFFVKYNIKKKMINIDADFQKKIFNIDFNCIFSLKIVNIIFMLIVMLKMYLKNKKGGDADVRSSNRRSNDYSHAKY